MPTIPYAAKNKLSPPTRSPLIRRIPGKIFALLIGIDKYQHYEPLAGAEKDVEGVVSFLSSVLSVPPSRIKKVLNGDATRVRIIREIKALQSNRNIKFGDPIFIYFSGHGARSDVPVGWRRHTPDGKLETICPVDISHRTTVSSPPVTGIPDIVLDSLISELAAKKGDNITVILDCCHSSNALRSGDVVPNFRNINDPPPLSQADLRLPGGGIGTLSQGKSLECSVLLAACRRDERAGENSSGGLFTQALLKHLEGVGNSGQNWPTYRQLIQSLNISESQHPHCEGLNTHRYLFCTETADSSLFYGRKDRGKYLLGAGKGFGFLPGDEFDIYGQNGPFSNRHICSLKIYSVGEHECIFTPPPADVELPKQFGARRTCLADIRKIRYYAYPGPDLHAMLLHLKDYSGFALPESSIDKAELLVSFKDDAVQFLWGNRSAVAIHAEKLSIGGSIPSYKTRQIARVFRAAALFHFYLHTGEVEPEISESWESEESESFAGGLELRLQQLKNYRQNISRTTASVMVDGPNLLQRDVAKVTIAPGQQAGPFGLDILNFSSENLYPHVFCFNSRTLNITHWFSDQVKVGLSGAHGCADAPLRACRPGGEPGTFTLGYGENNKSWGFTLPQGVIIDVTFLKVIATQFTADLTPMAQSSPFGDSEAQRGGHFYITDDNQWFVRRAAVVQVQA